MLLTNQADFTDEHRTPSLCWWLCKAATERTNHAIRVANESFLDKKEKGERLTAASHNMLRIPIQICRIGIQSLWSESDKNNNV